MNYWILVASAVLMIFTGCSGSPKKPGLYVADKTVSMDDVKSDDVVLIINGQKITKHDFEVAQSSFGKMFRMQRQYPLVGKNDKEAAFLKRRAALTFRDLFNRVLVKQEADRLGIVPAPSFYTNQVKATLRMLGRQRSSLQDVAREFGGEEGAWLVKVVEGDALGFTLRQTLCSNDLVVTEKEIDGWEQRIRDYNVTADATNAAQRVRLVEARKRVLAGEDFAKVAKEISQVEPQEGASWNEFELGELNENASLRQWLVEAKAGDVSEPLECDDGLMIVKLLGKGVGEAPGSLPKPITYRCARITVYAYQRAIEETRDEIRADLWKEKDKQALVKLGQRLLAEAVVEYPQGTNLFMRANQSKEKTTHQ